MKINFPNFSIIKKSFTLVFATSIYFSFFLPTQVFAWTDAPNLAVNTPTALSTSATAISTTANTTINAAHASWATLGKNTLDSLAYSAGQMALSQLTDNTVAWIRGGFHGSPSFAVDTEAIGNELADAVTLGLVSQIKGLATCEFTGEFIDNMTNAYTLSSKKTMPIKCPFPDSVTNLKIYGTDVEEAVNSFSWEVFGTAMDDAGNPYGVQIVTANQLQADQEAAKTSSDQKMSWSNGYADIIDTSKCEYPGEIGGYVTLWNAYQSDPSSLLPSEITSISAMDQTVINAWNQQYCPTTTPGNIVSTQLSKTLGLDMDRLGFADNLNKIISALLSVAVQSAIRSVF